MSLRIESKNPEVKLTKLSQPYFFSGDEHTFATIQDEKTGLTDFNVIIKRGKFKHELTRIIQNLDEKKSSKSIWKTNDNQMRFLIFYANQGQLTVSSNQTDKCFNVKEGDTCVIDSPKKTENWNVIPSDGDNDYFILKIF